MLSALLLVAVAARASEPLPSWNDGPAKQRVVAFVQAALDELGKDYVPPPERIAVFDNDGTLWEERPLPPELVFLRERLEALASSHPEWKGRPALREALSGDARRLAALDADARARLAAAAYAGLTTDEAAKTVDAWISSKRHPSSDALYTDLAYKPMRELLDYLRDNGFKTYIVSAGTSEFMRPWTERVYGIPPEQVIGTTLRLKLAADQRIMIQPQPDLVNDGDAEPAAVQEFIGRRPVVAFGASEGDLPLLKWMAAGPGPRLIGVIRHTDALREWAYDRKDVLDEAARGGWIVVDIKRDWKKIFHNKAWP